MFFGLDCSVKRQVLRWSKITWLLWKIEDLAWYFWNSVQTSSKNLLFTIARILNHQVNHWQVKHTIFSSWMCSSAVFDVFKHVKKKIPQFFHHLVENPRQVCAMGGRCSWRWRRRSSSMTCCEWYAHRLDYDKHATCTVPGQPLECRILCFRLDFDQCCDDEKKTGQSVGAEGWLLFIQWTYSNGSYTFTMHTRI